MTHERPNYPLVIGLDLDGVIIDHSHAKHSLAVLHGRAILPHETPSEIMRTLFDAPVWERIQTLLYENPAIATAPPLMRGVREGIEAIHTRGIPYYLISRRRSSGNGRVRAQELLKKRGLWGAHFSENNVFFVDRVEDKEITAQHLGITHFVDDELKVLRAMSRTPIRFLFDPYHALPPEESIHPIASWQMLVHHLLTSPALSREGG